jgi:hypothetical protein
VRSHGGEAPVGQERIAKGGEAREGQAVFSGGKPWAHKENASIGLAVQVAMHTISGEPEGLNWPHTYCIGKDPVITYVRLM